MNRIVLSNIDLILESVFQGFGISILLFYFLTRIDKRRLSSFYEQFIYYAIRIVRISGIIYGIYFVYLIITNFDWIVDRFSDPDYVSYSIFTYSRYLLIVIISQLFWIKKNQFRSLRRSIIITVLFVLSLLSNSFLERYVIIFSTYQRDGLGQEIYGYSISELLAIMIPSFIITRIVTFSVLVFLVWGISSLFKKSSR